MSKKVSEYIQHRVEEDLAALGADAPSSPEFEAVDAVDAVDTFDLDALVAVLKSVSEGLKLLQSRFDPADSRGDAFQNLRTTLDNQIEGLIYAYDKVSEEL